MIFQKITFNDGVAVIENNPVTKFNSEETKKLGYVFHVREGLVYYDNFSITYALESNGEEGDEEYTTITQSYAKTLLRNYIINYKNIDRKNVDDHYNELLVSLVEL
jgi:hypothetical protein